MHEKPASEILMRTMGWSREDVTEHLADLQALSSYGYDEYQQFRPGMRFIESLASWLNQLPQGKRQAAFRFVKERLLYVTRDQMRQIVSVIYGEHIVPVLLGQVSRESKPKIPRWRVSRLFRSKEFKTLLDGCLFVGLSDGSQFGVFRRITQGISHEQMYRTHEISGARKDKLKEELKNRLGAAGGSDPRFRNVFLFDDFSASGKTYLREGPPGTGMEGKIAVLHKSITDECDPVSELVNPGDLRVWLILCIATERAKNTLQDLGRKLFLNIPFSVIVIHTIPDGAKYREEEDGEFTELIKNKEFGWDGLLDENMRVGDTSKPYLGFDACALPLILNHNTPNNSLPILYRNEEGIEFKGLFPRISRH